ncbi:MAG: hypothetical protein WBD17_00005, partial [Candidatus Omnitrophota bacterium]
LKLVFVVWIALWVLFLVREDKDGQYGALKYLYTHSGEDRTRFIIGEPLYGFLLYCRENIPMGSSYQLLGFKKFSIDEVRARYFLWPLVSVPEDPDFKVVYGKGVSSALGYKEYGRYGEAGCLLIRKDLVK